MGVSFGFRARKILASSAVGFFDTANSEIVKNGAVFGWNSFHRNVNVSKRDRLFSKLSELFLRKEKCLKIFFFREQLGLFLRID
jgi:hypothetical protein